MHFKAWQDICSQWTFAGLDTCWEYCDASMFIHSGEQNMNARFENNMFGLCYFKHNPGLYSFLPAALQPLHPCGWDSIQTSACCPDWPVLLGVLGFRIRFCFVLFFFTFAMLGQLREGAGRPGSPGELPLTFKSTITTLGEGLVSHRVNGRIRLTLIGYYLREHNLPWGKCISW